MAEDIILTIDLTKTTYDLRKLEGRTFQIHTVSPDEGLRIRLYSVELIDDIDRCPIVVGGERCGREAGHSGKHCWASGD